MTIKHTFQSYNFYIQSSFTIYESGLDPKSEADIRFLISSTQQKMLGMGLPIVAVLDYKLTKDHFLTLSLEYKALPQLLTFIELVGFELAQMYEGRY